MEGNHTMSLTTHDNTPIADQTPSTLTLRSSLQSSTILASDASRPSSPTILSCTAAPAGLATQASASGSGICVSEHPLLRLLHLLRISVYDYIGLMDGTSVEPLAQSVVGSTTNQMEEIEGEEQSAPKPAPPNQNPSEDATDKDHMEEEVILKRKRKKTSKIWDHFTIVTGNGTQKEQALCMYCKSKIYYDGTTSTCLRHLQSCKPHNDQIQKQQLLNFPPSMSSIDSGQKKLPTLIRPDKYDSNKMREAIATWVMGTEQPFSVVDDELYVNMMKTASPFFEKVSRTTIKEDCFKIYDHEKKRLKALLKSVSKISLTTDCWKSTHKTIEYMVITGHFIDQNWRLQKRVLSFVHVPPPRGGNDIADAIYKCLKEWEIEEKIFTISVDNNASYNDKALKRLKEIFSRVRKLVCGGRLFHVRCCAHILNLLVRDGLGTIDSVIGEVREAIKYLNNSEARLQRFSDYAHQLQIKDRKLVLDVPTRWNSTYDMLFVALKFKDVFPRFAESDPLFSHLPIDKEWEHVECVCEILKVFKDCTTIISGNDYPTSNLYLIEVGVQTSRAEPEPGQAWLVIKPQCLIQSAPHINFCTVSFPNDEWYASITLPPALNVDSDATVETGIARTSIAIFDKTRYFSLCTHHHSKALNESIPFCPCSL
ncbi:hypothetical protein LXL04_028968 [Taraxacum kok-saghyz]